MQYFTKLKTNKETNIKIDGVQLNKQLVFILKYKNICSLNIFNIMIYYFNTKPNK